MKDKTKKIILFVKQNQRYFGVFLVLFLTFLINKSFPAEIISPEQCENNDCQIILKKPSIGKTNSKFYVNDIFNSENKEFYRLIFQVEANQKTNLEIYTTNALDQDKKIEEISIGNSGEKKVFETIFETDKEYSDLLFRKTSLNDSSEIFINQVNISRLNIANEKELSSLKPTIIGGADLEIKDQEQNENDYAFDQLKEENLVFGQIFEPQFNFLTSIELDLNIIKQANNGGKKYALELREIEYESSNVPDIQSHPIATVKFSLNDLEFFREKNGKYLFPILAKVEKGKKYFFGLNNDRVDVDDFNHLLIRGTRNELGYPTGSTAAKYKKASYGGPGDLYFKTYGFELKKYQGINVLPGSIIEDRGKGRMFFSYHSPGGQLEMINLESRSEDIAFDKDKQAIYGEINEKNPPFFIYHFETIYPFLNFSLQANQGDISWNGSKISYSFNKKDWLPIFPKETKDKDSGIAPQSFEFANTAPRMEKEIYLKVEPDMESLPQKSKFGIKNLFFQAELISK